MDKRFFNDVAPLINNKAAWDALLVVIAHQKEKVVAKLLGQPSAEGLIRLSGEYEALNRLERIRDTIINAEKELN